MRPEILTMAKEALDMFAFLMTELIIFFSHQLSCPCAARVYNPR
jgi:hypothetical protein